MLGGDHRSHIGRRIERIADDEAFGLGHDAVEKGVLDPPVDDLAHVGGAVLPAVPEGRVNRAGDERVVYVGVVEHDERALAAHLEADVLEIALAGVFQKVCADFGGPGEQHAVDVHMPADRLTRGFAEAGRDIEDAGRQARLDRELRQPQRSQRRLFGRLQDDRAARRQRRRKLPSDHQQRKVPRQHEADDADRLLHDHRHRVLAGRRDLAERLVDQLAVPLEERRHFAADLVEAVADGFAAVEALHDREVFGVRAHEIGQAKEHGFPLLRRAARPHAVLEGASRSLHGDVDVGCVAMRHDAEEIARRRIDVVEGLAGRRRPPVAIDEGPARKLQARGDLR